MFLTGAKLRVKLFLILFFAILIPLVIASVILFKKLENTIKDQTAKAFISSINLTVDNIDGTLKTIEYSFIPIVYDTRFTALVTSREKFSQYEKLVNYKYIFDLLRNVAYQNKGIESYYLYVMRQQDFLNTKSTFYENVNETDLDFLKQTAQEGRKLWVPTVPFQAKNRVLPWLITCTKFITDEDNHRVAALAMNVNETFIKQMYDRIVTDRGSFSLILDSDAKVIFQSPKKVFSARSDYVEINRRITRMKTPNSSFLQRIGTENYLTIFSISDYTGWRYLKIIPLSALFGPVFEGQQFLFILIAAATLIVLVITYLLANLFYKPIEKLVQAMQKIESRDLEVRIVDNRQDEYQLVYQGFNNMVAELNNLIHDLTNEKLLKKELKIKFLQAQINPHFLYNTLESINNIAKVYKIPEISTMILALSKFFRASLSGGKDIVTLQEELELARNYLTIQDIRFQGKIRYLIDIPETLQGCLVPKLILQPVVENAVYHGIEKKRGNGLLKITGAGTPQGLELVVEDDGIGIHATAIGVLRESLRQAEFNSTENYALKIINQQLKLRFGDDYGIQITSEYGQGTKVTILLPNVTA